MKKLVIALAFASLLAVTVGNPTQPHGHEEGPYDEVYDHNASPYYGYDLAHFGYDRKISSYGYYIGPYPFDYDYGYEDTHHGYEDPANGYNSDTE